MKLLALDTTTEACSVAVLIANEVRATRFRVGPRQHAELILPYCEAALADAGLGIGALDAIACTRGPGAFTGVRIGLSVAQGLAFAAGLPVMPVSTLATLAQGGWRCHAAERLAVAIDARMAEVYWGCYEVDGEGVVRQRIADQVVRPTQVDLPPAGASDWVGIGTGWGRYPDELGARLAVVSRWPQCYPDARDVAVLAVRAGAAQAPESLEPVYLRNQVAARPVQSLAEPNAF